MLTWVKTISSGVFIIVSLPSAKARGMQVVETSSHHSMHSLRGGALRRPCRCGHVQSRSSRHHKVGVTEAYFPYENQSREGRNQLGHDQHL